MTVVITPAIIKTVGLEEGFEGESVEIESE